MWTEARPNLRAFHQGEKLPGLSAWPFRPKLHPLKQSLFNEVQGEDRQILRNVQRQVTVLQTNTQLPVSDSDGSSSRDYDSFAEECDKSSGAESD